MKYVLRALSLCAAALLLCAPALAGGLPTVPPAKADPLPDPGFYSKTEAVLFEKDYEYKGLRYDAWWYGKPADTQAFLGAWAAALESAGYTVTTGQEDGNDALFFESGAGRGFLLYDYQGRMLLMAPEAMGFVRGTRLRDWDIPDLKPFCLAANRKIICTNNSFVPETKYSSSYYRYDYTAAGESMDITWAERYIDALIQTGDFVLVGENVVDSRAWGSTFVRHIYAFAWTGEKAAEPIRMLHEEDIWTSEATLPDACHLVVSISQNYADSLYNQDKVGVQFYVSPSLIYEGRNDPVRYSF